MSDHGSRALLAVLLLLAFGEPSPARAEPDGRFNVLLIVVDDLRPVLGSYGNPHVVTPNIDRIASWGVRFERAYSQSPLCNPSRASMLTGRYPTETEVWDNTTPVWDAHPEFVSLPAHFRENGYHTLRAGKIHHRKLEQVEVWTEGGRRAKAGVAPQSMDRIDPLDGDGETHFDYKNATRAIRMLERHQNERFFLAVGFSKPHVPLAAPQHLLDLYAEKAIPLPVDFASWPRPPKGFPRRSVPSNTDIFVGRPVTPEAAREFTRAYYASTSFSDANVGRVVEAVDRLGLRDETVIVLWSDHGFHLGEKGKWSKNDSLFEVGLRVPLIIVSPDHPSSAGRSSRRVVESLDLYATLADLCGIPRPVGIRGRTLRPLLADPEAHWQRPAYSFARFADGIAASVRTERWRYAVWKSGESMLFDHRVDPAETRNLAEDPAYEAVVREMRGYLVQVPRWGVGR